MAWLFARKEWPFKSVLETIVLLPLVMPPVSTGLILLKIFGRRSPLGQWLYERGVEIVFNWKGVLIAMAVMSFPLLVRSVRTSFSEVNPRLEQIAATLGASSLRIFFVITIPLAYKGIIAGALLAFSRALGEFGATILLAAIFPVRHKLFRWRSTVSSNWARIREPTPCWESQSRWRFCSSGARSGCCARQRRRDMLLRCRIPLAHFDLDVDVPSMPG